MNKTVTALILAAGSGTRAGTPVPKQYMDINGCNILRQTILKFYNHPKVNTVQIVIAENSLKYYKKHYSDLNIPEPVIGGNTRTQSSINGLQSVKTEYVIIHDAARPFISNDIIDSVINGFETHDAVIPCIDINDSLKTIHGKNIDRTTIKATQTPQGFKTDVIKQAYLQNQLFTDDATAVENITPIKIVNGSRSNIKITTKQDFKNQPKIPKIGHGYDVHAFKDGNYLTLCGIKIPHNKGFLAHSDGDVAMHALTDALYGAIAERDIGYHFPNNDNKWKNADSSIFLKHAMKLIKQKNGYISNIDITIVCEYPKINKYQHDMKVKLANIMNIEINQISIKATTSESLGFTGRKEGIAANASVIVMI